MQITDEMVEKARAAMRGTGDHKMRAALEAVAPLIIAPYEEALGRLSRTCDRQRAAGMREAAKLLQGPYPEGPNAILARAAELEKATP